MAEAGIAWVLLATLVLYVDPDRLSRPLALLVVSGPLCGALASPALLWAMWRDPSDLWWYRRYGYRCAIVIGSLFVLQALQQLTAPRIALFAAVALGLFLLRWRSRRAGSAVVAEEPAAALQAVAPPTSPTPTSARPQLVQRIGRGTR